MKNNRDRLGIGDKELHFDRPYLRLIGKSLQ